MNRIRILFNPKAGRKDDRFSVEDLILSLVHHGLTVSLFKTEKARDAYHETIRVAESGDHDLIICAGGDGTLNEVINGLMSSPRKIPLAVFPMGTMNDFSEFLKLPRDPEKLVPRILNDQVYPVDVGKIDDTYFINVASMGIFTSVAHTTTKESKNLLGPLAYYLEVLKQFSAASLPKAKISIHCQELTYEGDFVIFLISNSSSIGGFHNMAPNASVNDGRFDCVLIKKAPVHRLVEVFLKILSGQHITSEFVTYFQTSRLSFTTEEEVDIDGEYLGSGTYAIDIIHKAIQMII
ncbi:MAG: hypothetical protein AVO33_05775 [delta proteobacterium ML8_F1]|nr:MAG: hypothetical protein AVO33_05775 [delta proteobacterium ML8_F1]